MMLEDSRWRALSSSDQRGLGAGGWLSLRLRRTYGLRASYEWVSSTEISADRDRLLGGYDENTTTVGAHVGAILGELRMGPVLLSAGPALLQLTSVRHQSTTATVSQGDVDTRTSERLTGGRVELGVRLPERFRMAPIFSVGYSYFPETEVEIASRQRVPLTTGGLTLMLSVEARP
jgi:hypothetical protein